VNRIRRAAPGSAPKSAEFPHGQLQPTSGSEPAIFVADAKTAVTSLRRIRRQRYVIGVKLGVGVAWQFTKNIGVFTEYRYTTSARSSRSATGRPCEREHVRQHLTTCSQITFASSRRGFGRVGFGLSAPADKDRVA